MPCSEKVDHLVNSVQQVSIIHWQWLALVYKVYEKKQINIKYLFVIEFNSSVYFRVSQHFEATNISKTAQLILRELYKENTPL